MTKIARTAQFHPQALADVDHYVVTNDIVIFEISVSAFQISELYLQYNHIMYYFMIINIPVK